MYDRILVPVDGSPTAKRGLSEALKLAAKLGSTVRVIHVMDDASVTEIAGMLATNVGELLMSRACDGEQFLTDAQSRGQTTWIERRGDPASLHRGTSL